MKEGSLFLCDNGGDSAVQRGAFQLVELKQTVALPFVVSAESKAEGVGGRRDGDYSLHVDLNYTDGSHLWSQKSSFKVGTHDWERGEVVINPGKPVRSITVHMLLRRHTGKAWFRNPQVHAQTSGRGISVFDGEPVTTNAPPVEGFLIRDVKAKSAFVSIEKNALDLQLKYKKTKINGTVFMDAWIKDTSGKDRAVTLYYAVPVKARELRWFPGPRLSRSVVVDSAKEYMVTTSFDVGMGKLSKYPLAAVGNADSGTCLGIDMAYPAFFRLVYSASTEELFVAYDIGLTPENPEAHVRFCTFSFEPKWGFRSALAHYYTLFPDAFRCRTPEQGQWMAFAKIGDVQGWEDFGFKFKEGTNQIDWDDKHGITTFRYTETSSWWMRMPKDMPRTMEAALPYVNKLAKEGNKKAQALLTSGFHDDRGQLGVKFKNAPWCDGAVWSMNSMPDVKGAVTDFKVKWNPEEKEKYYGYEKKGDLDGEYIDSSEGFVTGILNFRRDHLAVAQTPLTFSKDRCVPAQFCGLISFEYVRAIAQDVHGMGKLMMANATPTRFCWLTPLMDVLGTETVWFRGEGIWHPMSDAEMLYKRALAKGKPYCFLMCVDFNKFTYEFVEKYMKRSLAYGMFPGFFSPEYSQRSHYFYRPDFYNRDRPLFKKYVPLCKLVAEAGWEPITLAHSSDENVHVERFGRRYLTVFNDSKVPRDVTITLEKELAHTSSSRELLSG
ncbi:MAG: hypothetical protein KAI66_08155, partial [Lentisphaeria bacterium]|nr:hypothetical protein [Lentisphaeria bacterium]